MIQQAAHILDEALRLPDGQRAELAARLIESLNPAFDEGIEAGWAHESVSAWKISRRDR